MQEGIHPEYGPVVFYDRSADKYFLTKSTLVAKAVNLPTIDWEDGNTYPLVNVEVSSYSHPFYTGKNVVIDAAGQVQKFNASYGRKRFAAHSAKTVRQEERNGHEGQGIGPLIGPQGWLLCRPPARPSVCNQQEEPPLEGEARLMALPKYKASRANTHSRRANWKAKVPQLATARTPEGEVVQVPQNLAAAVRKGYMKP